MCGLQFVSVGWKINTHLDLLELSGCVSILAYACTLIIGQSTKLMAVCPGFDLYCISFMYSLRKHYWVLSNIMIIIGFMLMKSLNEF